MVEINIFCAKRQNSPICWLFGRMDTGVAHEEDCSALLPDGGAGSDDCVEVGHHLVSCLEAQQWNVDFSGHLANFFGILEVQDSQDYLLGQRFWST